MGRFIVDYDLRQLKGAPYNPRRIDAADLAELGESLKTLGIVKPIIVRNETVVAGHQRVRAALAAGITHGPVYALEVDANVYDEVRFNQLHNGTDLDDGATRVQVTRDLLGVHGWTTLQPDKIDGDFRDHGAVIRVEIQRLTARFGAWGVCVVAPNGEVIHCRHYALALAAMRVPIPAYVLSAEQVEPARRFLGRGYGVFSYDHLPKNTYVQTYAQPYRMRNEKFKRSRTYDEWALPWLRANPGARLLDFGCGHGEHVDEARRLGFDVTGVELFRRAVGVDALDVGATKRMVQTLADELRERGQFDAVLCDFVINSVDCPEAERSVLACLDLFVKPGGRLFITGRPVEHITNALRRTKTKIQGFVYCLDANGFGAVYKQGEWFYQRFHTREEVDAIPMRYGWELTEQKRNVLLWGINAVKREQVLTLADYEAAIRYEFNMSVNAKGRRLGMADEVLAAARQCL